jgi:hypothetical protein
MSQGVFTPDLRVRWINLGVMTPEDAGVGDGTAYPLEVTLDQIAEIFYRAKDAHFTGGRASYGTGDPYIQPEGGFEITAPTTAATNRSTDQGNLRRGYTTITESGLAVISAHNDAYLGDEYDTGSGVMYRDVNDKENGVWMRGEQDAVLPYWDFESGPNETTNAFSFNCEDSFSPTTSTDCFMASSWFALPWVTTDIGPVQSFVRFTGNVVVLLQNANDHVVSITNRYFLEFEFYSADTNNIAATSSIIEISTNEASITSGTAVPLLLADQTTACRYVMKLSSGDVTCPIYIADGAGGGGLPFQLGEDFIHEATKWWPYAKNYPAEPVWDANTGLKI